MDVKMTAIAESKVSQLGGDVCGVLIRNEAGSYAAISECGRVMWFDDSRQSANGQRNANDELLAALSDYRGKVAELQAENKRLREENERLRDHGDAELEGWKRVPIESTSGMDIAGMDSLYDSDDGYAIDRHAAEIIWKAMVSAAPTFQRAVESEKAGGNQ